MCKFASFVLTKDQEFWSENGDSHSEIISSNNLHEWGTHGPNIVKVEISPTDKIKKWPSLKAWKFTIDRHKLGFKTVGASGCTALTELKADAAKTVYASGCTALTELKADAAAYVYASGCNPKLIIKTRKGAAIYR